ncbi:Polysaccharide biosynthesis protein [Bacteroidales bacterium Barb7]|nr:Polysaccharide biosynthesis protein [Bacteroidales bacterium Barb7]
MLKKIAATVGSRYLIALLNLALIFVNAKVLGVAGVGMIGLIMASMNMVVIFCGILSRNTLVYFMGKYAVRTLFLVAHGWTCVGAAVATGAMSVTGLIPEGYAWDVFGLAVVHSFVGANTGFLLGKDRIKALNCTYILQGGLLFFVLLYFYFGAGLPEIRSYIRALYITNGAAFAASLLWVLPYLREKGEAESPPLLKLLREMSVYGLWAAADNLAESLTTRLNYFLIQHFGGMGSVGLLDAGTKMSESVWHISRSVSLLEYGNVSRSRSLAEQKDVTLRLFKLTFCALSVATGCILCIPEWVYTDYLFSPEFTGIRQVIKGLSVGIVAFGSNSILSHFFIGSGRVRYSTYCSCTGLVVLLAAGGILIPGYGVTGAAVSCSIAFSAMLAFSLAAFVRQTDTRMAEFFQ